MGAATQPVLWSALGYRFEAASMIAGLSACLMVRIWMSLNAGRATAWTWAVDLTVTGLSLLFTAGWIVLQRPAPFYALLSGTGFGALGAGIIVAALAWVKRIEPLAGLVAGPVAEQGDAPAAAPGAETHAARR
ncbi:hypothetical protein [Sphingomonas bacterium]|uniref:hypothetical protein n=1 Tax=Sphingomonas bacterium TaxID=1895847 RepID=UPI001575CB46|nr:hypothetical protein [Sphingomonas bacterium]